jgi:hypothetical protein
LAQGGDVNELTCDEVQYAAPQFALDILEAGARAEVAAHLIRCPGCREQVSGMQESAARLLDLRDVPGVDHPSVVDLPNDRDLPDHSDRFDRIDYADHSDRFDYFDYFDCVDDPEAFGVRPGRRRLRVVVTLAAVAVLFVGTTLGPELGQRARSSVPATLATATLLQANRAVGTVNFYARHTPTVELVVRGVSAKGWLRCELVALDGEVVALGSFKLHEGSGYWGSSTKLDPSKAAGFDLVDTSGRLVASGQVASGQIVSSSVS